MGGGIDEGLRGGTEGGRSKGNGDKRTEGGERKGREEEVMKGWSRGSRLGRRSVREGEGEPCMGPAEDT